MSPLFSDARFSLLACVLLASGCTAIANFDSFKFSSDAGDNTALMSDAAGPDGSQSKPDAGASCRPAAKEDCGDRVDNDCDGLEDCNDPDCKSAPECCKPNEIPEVSCSGEVDNDCDGDIDCADADCSASTACCAASVAEVGDTACSDGIDNDCDGLTDCEESACTVQSTCCVPSGAENNAASCSDGVDNDCDGKLDCNDPSCAVVAECCTSGESRETTCDDATDNDCDGLADCRDPDCEKNTVCKDCVASAATESSCSDYIDNDCDKDRDCLDSDCKGSLDCCVKTETEQGDSLCIDGVDNDCDGLADCADPKCASLLSCCVASGSEGGEDACRDHKDNDCDGKTDCDDDGCKGSTDCCVSSGIEVGTMACNDGLDNDCDGSKDCGDAKCGDVSGCCVANGTEASQPNDGQDNDCNGLIDIPIASATTPTNGMASSGQDVTLMFVPSIVAGATLECSTQKLSQIAITPVYTDCTADAGKVRPFNDAQSKDANNDGAWVTNVRWRFPKTGAHSDSYAFKYYVHHTLHEIERCTPTVSDARWFDLAKQRLTDTKVFITGDSPDTSLANPFIRVSYEPPAAALAFLQTGTKQSLEMWSLRKRFTLDSENKYLLITRTYVSNRDGRCAAAYLRYHRASTMVNYSCDAVVLNRSGAGVCMNAGKGGTAVFAHDSNDKLADKLGWPKANKFMWRQLLDAKPGGKIPKRAYSFDDNVHYRNFTSKCTGVSNKLCLGASIYLPDRALLK